jgi:hypothetical protein
VKRVYWGLLATLGACALVALLTRRSSIDLRQPFPLANGAIESRTRQVGQRRWIISRSDRDAYLADLTRVTQHATLKPTLAPDGKKVQELVIASILPESPLYVAGFRKDDRILTINGTSVQTLERAANLVHEIRACTALTVQVDRVGSILTFEFAFR